MKSNKTFAERLLFLRKQAGLSRRELARRMGVTHPCIWHWEEGKSLPRHYNMDVLCRLLEVTPDYLRFGEERLSDLTREIMRSQQRIAALAGLEPSKVTILVDHEGD